MTIASLDDIRHETERNHEVFRQLVGGLLADHSGDYALMKSGRVIEFFSKDVEALKAGEARFPDRLYSIHRIRARTDRPPSLNGAMSVDQLRR